MTKDRNVKRAANDDFGFNKRFQNYGRAERTCVSLCPTAKDGSCIRADKGLFPRACRRQAMGLFPSLSRAS